MLVREVMTTDVVTARPETSIRQLVDDMVRCGVGGLPVVDGERHVVGMVTEADVVARQAYGEPRHRMLTALQARLHSPLNRWTTKAIGSCASDIMTAPAHTASPLESVRHAAAAMVTLAVKRLPVVNEEGRLVGIVSQRDLLRLAHRTDDEIRLGIRATLDDPMRCPEEHGVEPLVEDGRVTLSGWARTPMDIDLIVAMVREVPGVMEVRDGLTANEHDPSMR